jgi:hypothetical protein
MPVVAIVQPFHFWLFRKRCGRVHSDITISGMMLRSNNPAPAVLESVGAMLLPAANQKAS